MSKSWFTYPIWTIGTYKLLLVGLEFTVKRSNYIKKLAVMFNFCSYFLPWLGLNARTTMLRRNKASHCFLELNWDVQKWPGLVVCPFLSILGLQNQSKIDNFCSYSSSLPTLSFHNQLGGREVIGTELELTRAGPGFKTSSEQYLKNIFPF